MGKPRQKRAHSPSPDPDEYENILESEDELEFESDVESGDADEEQKRMTAQSDDLYQFERRQQRLVEVREQIALIAAQILEDPQTHVCNG